MQATSVAESEEKAEDQAKQDLAVAKAGAPKPGQNGNGKQPPKAMEPLKLTDIEGLPESMARMQIAGKESDKQLSLELAAVREEIHAVASAKPTPQPITVHSPPVTVTMPKMDIHIHNDGKTVTTREIKDIKRDASNELLGAKIVETTEREGGGK